MHIFYKVRNSLQKISFLDSIALCRKNNRKMKFFLCFAIWWQGVHVLLIQRRETHYLAFFFASIRTNSCELQGKRTRWHRAPLLASRAICQNSLKNRVWCIYSNFWRLCACFANVSKVSVIYSQKHCFSTFLNFVGLQCILCTYFAKCEIVPKKSCFCNLLRYVEKNNRKMKFFLCFAI